MIRKVAGFFVAMVMLVSFTSIVKGDTMSENLNPEVSRVTALLPVPDTNEAAMFMEKVGFERTSEVSENPNDPSTPLGFVIMVKADMQVMLQSIASIRNDDEGLLPQSGSQSFLFIEVKDLEALISALKDYPVFMERRKTFYGSDEIGIVAPGGHKITFAQFGASG